MQIELGRRQERAFDVVTTLLVALGDAGDEGRGGLPAGIRLQGQDACGQIVEECRGRLEEQRQIVFQPARRAPLGDLAIHQAGLRVALEARPIALAKPGDRLLRQREFTRRQHPHPLQLLLRALRLRVEGADRLDLLIEEVDAQRDLAAHREDVEQGAAHRIFAVADDLGDAGIAGTLQSAPGRIQVQPIADRKDQRLPVHIPARRQALHQGCDRHDQHALLQARQAVQCQEPFRDQLRKGREDVVGQGLPVREGQQRECAPGQKEAELGAQMGSGLDIRHDRKDQPLMRAGGLGDRERDARAVEPPPQQALAGATGQRRAERRRHLV